MLNHRLEGSMHPVHQILLMTAFFTLGGLAGLASQWQWQDVRETVTAAFTNQYQVRSGHLQGNRVFYLKSDRAGELKDSVTGMPHIENVETTFLENILIVTVSDDITNTFNTLRRHDLVNAITTIPLFCH